MIYFLTLWGILGCVGFLVTEHPLMDDPRFELKMKVLFFLSGPVVWILVFLFCAMDWITNEYKP